MTLSSLAFAFLTTQVSVPPLPPAGPYYQVSEVMAGTHADPDVQYILLRMGRVSSDANNTLGYTVVVYRSTGTESGRFTLNRNVTNGAWGAPVLIATPAAEKFFNVTADFNWTTAVPNLFREGEICVYPNASDFSKKDDCFAYGDVHDSNNAIDSGITNFSFNPAGGLSVGMIAQRFQSSASSAADFWLVRHPWVETNAGVIGVVPTATCGNSIVEGLEQCDGGAGCSGTCLLFPNAGGGVCGDGSVDGGEQCDDANTSGLDGCSETCQFEFSAEIPPSVCGNGSLEFGTDPEQCDDGNVAAGDGCSSSCAIENGTTPACPDGIVEAGEQCDPASSNAACSPSTCRFAYPAHPLSVCGNNAVETGETCDDGNANPNDGCSATCLLETTNYFYCGSQSLGGTPQPPVIEPGEACDDGSSNGNPNSPCKANCQWVSPPVNTTTSTTGGGSTSTTTTTGGTTTTTGGANTGSTGNSNISPTTSTGGFPSAIPTSSSSPSKNISCQSSRGGEAWAAFFALAALSIRRLRRVTTP